MQSEGDVIDTLTSAIRGDGAWAIRTPSDINDDMWPTDHAILLAEYVYPLCERIGIEPAKNGLELALIACTSDNLGIFCAHQCFYMQIVNETFNKSPFNVNRTWLPKTLNSKLNDFEAELATWVNPRYRHPNDALRVIKAGVIILERDHGVGFS